MNLKESLGVHFARRSPPGAPPMCVLLLKGPLLVRLAVSSCFPKSLFLRRHLPDFSHLCAYTAVFLLLAATRCALKHPSTWVWSIKYALNLLLFPHAQSGPLDSAGILKNAPSINLERCLDHSDVVSIFPRFLSFFMFRSLLFLM